MSDDEIENNRVLEEGNIPPQDIPADVKAAAERVIEKSNKLSNALAPICDAILDPNSVCMTVVVWEGRLDWVSIISKLNSEEQALVLTLAMHNIQLQLAQLRQKQFLESIMQKTKENNEVPN